MLEEEETMEREGEMINISIERPASSCGTYNVTTLALFE